MDLRKKLKFTEQKKKPKHAAQSNPWECLGLIYLFLIFLKLSFILNAFKKIIGDALLALPRF